MIKSHKEICAPNGLILVQTTRHDDDDDEGYAPRPFDVTFFADHNALVKVGVCKNHTYPRYAFYK